MSQKGKAERIAASAGVGHGAKGINNQADDAVGHCPAQRGSADITNPRLREKMNASKPVHKVRGPGQEGRRICVRNCERLVLYRIWKEWSVGAGPIKGPYGWEVNYDVPSGNNRGPAVVVRGCAYGYIDASRSCRQLKQHERGRPATLRRRAQGRAHPPRQHQ